MGVPGQAPGTIPLSCQFICLKYLLHQKTAGLLALSPPVPSSAQPAPAAPSSVPAGHADLGWPGGTMWVGRGDLGWAGPGLGLHHSQPASRWPLTGCGSNGRWRPAQSVPAAAWDSTGHWRPSARDANLVRNHPGQAPPQPFPLTLGLGSPGGKGPGLLGRQPAICARWSPHCSAQGEQLGTGSWVTAQAPHSVQGCPGPHRAHLGVEGRE